MYEYAELFIETRVNVLEEQLKSQSSKPSEPAEG